ncbi:MAG: class I SAM-dependent methyltransferase, partial [Holosporales bacterium]|nr:class I SAM-dependent methyltransferase [Holosporales bacterium]
MSLGLFRKSLVLHQWIAGKCGVTVAFGPASTRLVYSAANEEDDSTHVSLYNEYDYVRGRALELMRKQIGDLPGSVAEAGVDCGEFARLINFCFPDRKLFLYDTFGGYVKEELVYERKNNLSNFAGDNALSMEEHATEALELMPAYWLDKFPSLSLDATPEERAAAVKKTMPFPDQCVWRIGHFPDTVMPEEENEKFVFVSIDINLYQPTRAALEFFYPRLQAGGVIFVHD